MALKNTYNPVVSQNRTAKKHSGPLRVQEDAFSVCRPPDCTTSEQHAARRPLAICDHGRCRRDCRLAGRTHALLSALLGGLCCVVPNGLFALRLFANAQKAGAANPMAFFIGEFIKIALTVALLGAVAWLYRDLNWLALIAGFIVALKSYIILLFRH